MTAAQLLFGICLVALAGGVVLTLVANLYYVLKHEGDEPCSDGE